jgi:hypothetical protein
MTNVLSSSVALFAASMFAGCHSSGSDAPPQPGLPADSVVLEIDGKAFQAGCANGSSAGGFTEGATCGSAAEGAGPNFDSVYCDNLQTGPIYFLGTEFRNLDAAGVSSDLTFDLSDPDHEEYVTVMMNYTDDTRTEYHYCTAPPLGADGGAFPSSTGLVTLHRFISEPDALAAVSDAEVTNAIVPSLDGGPAITIVAAHLYFQ